MAIDEPISSSSGFPKDDSLYHTISSYYKPIKSQSYGKPIWYQSYSSDAAMFLMGGQP